MDIVKRLRAAAELDPWYHEANEAADEIERLREKYAELAELMQATVNYTGAVVGTNNFYFAPKPKATVGE